MWPWGTGSVTFLVPSYQSLAGPFFFFIFFFLFCTIQHPPKAAANSPAELAQRGQAGPGEEVANSSLPLRKYPLCTHACPMGDAHTSGHAHARRLGAK